MKLKFKSCLFYLLFALNFNCLSQGWQKISENWQSKQIDQFIYGYGSPNLPTTFEFINPKIGFIHDKGAKTSDSAETFNSFLNIFDQKHLRIRDICHTDQNTYYAVGDSSWTDMGDFPSAIILKITSDSQIKVVYKLPYNNPFNKDSFFYKCFFLNSDTGFVYGVMNNYKDNFLVMTEDGGNTWIKKNVINLNNYLFGLAGLQFTSPKIAYALGGQIKSIDGGQTWVSTKASGTKSHYINDTLGFFIYDFQIFTPSDKIFPVLYRTEDGGFSKETKFLNPNLFAGCENWKVTSLYFENKDVGYISVLYTLFRNVTNSNTTMKTGIVVLKTRDGGNSWLCIFDEKHDGGIFGITQMKFFDKGIGYFLARERYLYKTTSGGDSLGTITGINYNHGNQNDNLVLGPNPMIDKIYLFNHEKGEYRLELTDIQGRIVRVVILNRNNGYSFDNNFFKEGIYFYKIFEKDIIVNTGKIESK